MTSELEPPAEKGRVVILTSGTTGTPKGAPRKQPDSLEPAAALFSKIPLQRARDDDDRRADVPLVGLRALHARRCRWPRRSCCGGASTPRRRCGRSPQHRASALVVVPVMLQRILELATGDDRPLRHAAALQRDRAQRLGAAGRAGDARDGHVRRRRSTTSTARPRSRGRRSPRPRTCARRRGPPGRPPLGTVVKLLDDDGHEVAAGRGRAHLRRQRDDVRGLHRRRRQGDRRRADEHRRRRPLRRSRDACSSTGATTK